MAVAGVVRPVTFVLVHGAWHGPWCWENVAGELGASGHGVVALTLPGHDKPGTRTRLWNRMSQYVRTIADAMDVIDGPAILVGHSMGGYAVQLYLERGRATRGVLVASVPAAGTLRPNLRVLRNHPRAAIAAPLLADYSFAVSTEKMVRELFFTADTPDPIVAQAHAKVQNESALALNLMVVRRPKASKVTTPITVIAGSGDRLFSVAEQTGLAASYGTTPTLLDGGHDLMLDSCWPELAEHLQRLA